MTKKPSNQEKLSKKQIEQAKKQMEAENKEKRERGKKCMEEFKKMKAELEKKHNCQITAQVDRNMTVDIIKAMLNDSNLNLVNVNFVVYPQ